MRAAIAACSVARHADHGGGAAHGRRRVAVQHAPVSEVAHDLLDEERIARRPSAIWAVNPATEGSGPRSSAMSFAACESLSGARAIV